MYNYWNQRNTLFFISLITLIYIVVELEDTIAQSFFFPHVFLCFFHAAFWHVRLQYLGISHLGQTCVAPSLSQWPHCDTFLIRTFG